MVKGGSTLAATVGAPWNQECCEHVGWTAPSAAIASCLCGSARTADGEAVDEDKKGDAKMFEVKPRRVDLNGDQGFGLRMKRTYMLTPFAVLIRAGWIRPALEGSP